MDYFAQFPIIHYSLDDIAIDSVRDITLRVGLSNELRNSTQLYDEYFIQDGQTAENIATDIYGSPNFNWVVMLCNDIITAEDWPFVQRDLTELVALKYDNPLGIHHYENSDGKWVDDNTPLADPITNMEYETSLNDKKRAIRVIKPQLLSPFVDQFRAALK